MSARAVLSATALFLALHGTGAGACGHCIEDQIAVVYDHAALTRALGQQHEVAYFAVEGSLMPDDGTRHAIETIVKSVRGIDPGSLRLSVEPAALSVSFDPARVQIQALEQEMEEKLASIKLSLRLLRVMSRPAEMKVIGE